MNKYNSPFVILSRAIKMIAEILQTLLRHQIGEIGGVNAVLAYITQHQLGRANAISEALSIPIWTVERYLKELKVNKIEFRGAPRNGGYNLKEVING